MPLTKILKNKRKGGLEDHTPRTVLKLLKERPMQRRRQQKRPKKRARRVRLKNLEKGHCLVKVKNNTKKQLNRGNLPQKQKKRWPISAAPLKVMLRIINNTKKQKKSLTKNSQKHKNLKVVEIYSQDSKTLKKKEELGQQ